MVVATLVLPNESVPEVRLAEPPEGLETQDFIKSINEVKSVGPEG